MASSAVSEGIGRVLASGALPVLTAIYPPACIRSCPGAAVDGQVLDHLEGHGPKGFNGENVAVVEMAHVQLA
jgi:hypothetical protein